MLVSKTTFRSCPFPVCTSSSMSRAPNGGRTASRSSARYPWAGILIPPSHWIGSTRTAEPLPRCVLQSGLHGTHIVIGYACMNPGTRGSYPDLHRRVSGRRQGRQGASVEAVVGDDDCGRPLACGACAWQPRQLDGRLVGFGTGVAEEGRVQPGSAWHKPWQQVLSCRANPVYIGSVHEPCALFGTRRHSRRRDGHGPARTPQAPTMHRDSGRHSHLLLAYSHTPSPRSNVTGLRAYVAHYMCVLPITVCHTVIQIHK